MMGGSRVDLAKFREGWLLPGWGKAHYYTRDEGGFTAKCGRSLPPPIRDASGFVAFEPGQFPKCKRCITMEQS